MKSVQLQSFFWSEYRKIRTRKNSVFGHFSRNVKTVNYFAMDVLFPTNPHNQQPQKKLAEHSKYAPNRKLFHYQYLLHLAKKKLSHFPQTIFTEKKYRNIHLPEE